MAACLAPTLPHVGKHDQQVADGEEGLLLQRRVRGVGHHVLGHLHIGQRHNIIASFPDELLTRQQPKKTRKSGGGGGGGGGCQLFRASWFLWLEYLLELNCR